MSDLKRSIGMKFNDVYVGKLDIFEDGQMIPEFVECDEANDCIYFLTIYALTIMLHGSGYAEPEIQINLN